mmetsp:Transcript_3494/g.7724  ORF Transcript_3494/g.7724 Transcript_3494/m.7724 type:complete len:86 (+) Transcript_3494:271-528(+)
MQIFRFIMATKPPSKTTNHSAEDLLALPPQRKQEQRFLRKTKTSNSKNSSPVLEFNSEAKKASSSFEQENCHSTKQATTAKHHHL